MAVKALDNANVEVVAINENPDDVRRQKKKVKATPFQLPSNRKS